MSQDTPIQALTIGSPFTTRKRAPSNHTPSPRHKEHEEIEWPWIEERKYYDNEYLGVEEGNSLDFKLTVFSDYMNFKTKKNKQQIQMLTTTPSERIIDYGKLGERMTEYLIAFLNTNGGALIFGVADDGKVQAMDLPEKQRDKIKLVLDSCIRNFQITPVPKANTDYKIEFVRTVNNPERFVIVLEVKQSRFFHFAHIRKALASWERLNASNFYLCDRPQRFIERIRELRDEELKLGEEFGTIMDGYLTLLFCDREVFVSERVCMRCGQDKKIFRYEQWCALDGKGRYIVDRPYVYYAKHYEFLQIGATSVTFEQYPVFLVEAEFYGLLNIYLDENQVKIIKSERGFSLLRANRYETLSKKVSFEM